MKWITDWLWSGRRADAIDGLDKRVRLLECVPDREEIDEKFEELEKQVDDLQYDVNHLDEVEWVTNMESTIDAHQDHLESNNRRIADANDEILALQSTIRDLRANVTALQHVVNQMPSNITTQVTEALRHEVRMGRIR